MAYKSGFVALVGRSNVGKSTLMNGMIGEKVAIVSPKAQPTRSNLQGVLTREGWQAVFIDTPGIHQPRTKLGEHMERQAKQALDDVDLAILVVDAQAGVGEGDLAILSRLEGRRVPLVVAVNKTDACCEGRTLRSLSAFSGRQVEHVLPISAKTGANVEELVEIIHSYMREGPQYFPDDRITDQPERVLAAELIREKALLLLNDEVPHGIGVEILSIKPRPEGALLDIHATIYCEKPSHKRIIIGKNGAVLREIGTQARVDLERLFGKRVYLNLWVKVQENWRNRASDLRTLGYE